MTHYTATIQHWQMVREVDWKTAVPWIANLTEVVLREVLGVHLHTLYVLPDTAAITADHVAIIVLELTDAPSHIVTIVLHR